MTARRTMQRWAGIGALVLMQGSALAPAAGQLQSPPATKPIAGQSNFTLNGPLTQGGAIIGRAPSGTTRLTIDGEGVPLTADGRFLIAFDRDAKPRALLVATLADGRTQSNALTIAPRAWNISRLPTLPKLPLPEPAFEKIRPGELAQINAARARVTDAAGWDKGFFWPAVGRISTLFGSQRVYANGEAGSYHSGIDIALPQGAPVLAPADGVVIFAADHPFTLEGNLLMLDHGMGLNSSFLHLSRIDVHVGEHIRRGETIGAVGMTGRATGPHLHWSLRWRDRRIDPLLVAGPMPTVR
jgi:murein DD-endopeptidase MepM/ murein hydrolase activator NlpD